MRQDFAFIPRTKPNTKINEEKVLLALPMFASLEYFPTYIILLPL